MSEAAAERRLKRAFILALTLHAVALAAVALLPAESSTDSSLDEVRVFRETAITVVTAVELVEWEEAVPEVALPSLQAAEKRPPARREPPSAARPAASASPGRPQSLAMTHVAQPSRPEMPAPETAPAPAAPDPGGGGGGGGGHVDMGSPSVNGDLAGMGVGRTPVGELPGEGAGSGGGAGPGGGEGSGGGSGNGTGVGAGSGVGEGRGSGIGGGEGDGGAGTPAGHVSRVADRAEPEVVHKGSLEYPPSAAADGVEGTVQMKVLVTETGAVAEVEVVRSSGDRRLDHAAAEWVGKWRYRPATQDGKARRVYTYAKVEFELR